LEEDHSENSKGGGGRGFIYAQGRPSAEHVEAIVAKKGLKYLLRKRAAVLATGRDFEGGGRTVVFEEENPERKKDFFRGATGMRKSLQLQKGELFKKISGKLPLSPNPEG